MKHPHHEQFNKRIPRSAWLLSLATIAIALGLTKQATAQTPSLPSQISPQQLQDIQRAIQQPPAPTNSLLVSPVNQSPYFIDQSQRFDILQKPQFEGTQPQTQGEPLLEIDPYYQSGRFQRELQQRQNAPSKNNQ